MKALLIVTGTLIACISYIVSPEKESDLRSGNPGLILSPEFKWTQVSPPNTGGYQEEWKPGQWPMGFNPVVGFGNDLWMIGQKMAWSSSDGIHWNGYPKKDWGDRISKPHVFFNNKLWVMGGLKINEGFQNDIWSSADGKTWDVVKEHAAWQPRKDHNVIAFNNKLWLFGGATKVNKDLEAEDFLNDIWSSEDGLQWTKVIEKAPWPARNYANVVVFKNQLWMLGEQGHSDIWRSPDGKNWTQIIPEAPWKDRDGFGVAVYENILFVYGGRGGNPAKDFNDVWYSFDGEAWHLQTEHAPWVEQTGTHSIVFKEKLWLYCGKHKGYPRAGDIWTMEPARK